MPDWLDYWPGGIGGRAWQVRLEGRAGLSFKQNYVEKRNHGA